MARTAGVRLSCKTPYAPQLKEKLGVDYYKQLQVSVLNTVPDNAKKETPPRDGCCPEHIILMIIQPAAAGHCEFKAARGL
ncbi:MAG: hypothetical protein ACOY40_11620 [Bacillota bacterium]